MLNGDAKSEKSINVQDMLAKVSAALVIPVEYVREENKDWRF